MPFLHDLRTARTVAGNVLRSRRNRRLVAKRRAAHPVPGNIQIAVYFADPAENLYQVRQWYAPLAELAKAWPVAIISRSPSATLALWDEAPVPVAYLRSAAELERFAHEQPLRIVLYVNQNAKNFQMFRYARMWHVFINHGESDKMYMTTNQFKAYDYALVAGDAALQRLGARLWDFDVQRRAIPIGRPQADHFAGEVPYPRDGRIVVLYAPTWEGDRAAAAYGSVVSHGEALAAAVLASPGHRLVYRPHPRSGLLDPGYGAANRRIIAAIAAANAADPAARHVHDDGPALGWQLADADVAITDISAMVYDRLAVGRPIVVTRPVSEDAEVDESGFLGAAQWLTADRAGQVLGVVDRALREPEALAELAHWSRHHFGDTSPGAATARFHQAIRSLMDRWDQHAAIHRDDPLSRESDPFILEDQDDEAPPGLE